MNEDPSRERSTVEQRLCCDFTRTPRPLSEMYAVLMQSQQVNEVEEVIKDLKTNPGFSAYVIMNNDGKE